MTTSKTTSPPSSQDLVTRKLVRDKFALLAQVGREKRAALALQDEATFYSSIVTDLLVAQGELLERLQADAKIDPELVALASEHTSRFHRLTKQLLSFWPANSVSQERILTLLNSDGLAKVLDSTQDGYLTLSTDLILENVERAIEATKGKSLRQSPASTATTQ